MQIKKERLLNCGEISTMRGGDTKHQLDAIKKITFLLTVFNKKEEMKCYKD